MGYESLPSHRPRDFNNPRNVRISSISSFPMLDIMPEKKTGNREKSNAEDRGDVLMF